MEQILSVSEYLLSLEEKLLNPDTRRSPDELVALLAEDFVEYASSGNVYNREQTIDALSKETAAEFRIVDFKTKELSENQFLATYIAERKILSGEAISKSLRSSIWAKENNKWKIVFHQGTPAGR